MALTDFIRAPSKKSLLALLKKADKLTPRLMDKLFEGVLFKSELKGFSSGGAVDHGELSGLTDDDHSQYLLASQATSRANFTTKWTDLTDGGETTLHIHDGRYYTETEITTTLAGYLPLTAGSTKKLTGDLYVDGGGFLILSNGNHASGQYTSWNHAETSYTWNHVGSGSTSTIYVNPIPAASSAAEINFFRSTNTTGDKITNWRVGTNSANIYHRIVNDVVNIGSYTAGNYVQIRPEGVYLVGTATMWDDLRVAADTTKLAGSKDPQFTVFKTNGAGSQGVFAYWFDDAAEEEVYFSVQMPHTWAEGTDIEPHVHWVAATTAAGAGTDVSWGLEYTWANINGTFGNTTIIYADEQSNGATEVITAGKHYLTDFNAISGSGKTMSSMLICRLFRDATGAGGTDDLVGDAGLLEFDIHYQVNSMGSKEEYVKGP